MYNISRLKVESFLSTVHPMLPLLDYDYDKALNYILINPSLHVD